MSEAEQWINKGDKDSKRQFGKVVGFTNNIAYDELLPSFEMYNYIFNRSVTGQGDEDIDLRAHAPPYNVPKTGKFDGDDDVGHRNVTEMVNGISDPNMAVLNNLDKINTLDDSPIEITIELTKSLPVLGEPVEIETAHKEYKPGDIVAGYILIKNKTQVPLPFEMFIVSLEGVLTVKSFSPTAKSEKPLRKLFLRMFDFTACYHIGSIEVYPTGTIMCDSVDKIDGTKYGFNIDKILHPNETRKKFFVFKLPEYILDDACDYSFPEHLNLLPSFGSTDTTESASTIKINENTGIGKLNNVRGSPVIVRDNALPGQSISYSIDVRCLAKKSILADLKLMNSTESIGGGDDLVLFKPNQYYFRVRNNEVKGSFNSDVSTEDQIKSLEKLALRTLDELLIKKSQLEATTTTNSNIVQRELNAQIQQSAVLKKQEQLNHSKRTRQDSIDKTVSGSTMTTKLPENINVYVVQETENKSFFSINKNNNSYVTINIETSDTNSIQSRSALQLNEELPMYIFPQISNNSTPLPSLSLSSTITAATINSKCTEKLKTTIRFRQSTSSTRHNKVFKPPSTIIIKPTLKQLTIQSLNPIPFSIDSEYFLTTSTTKLIHEKQALLKVKFNSLLHDLQELIKKNEGYELVRHVPKLLINDLKSILGLSFFERAIPNVFKEMKIHIADVGETTDGGLPDGGLPVWEYDDVNDCYFVDFEFDLEKRELADGVSLVSTFQSCYLSRLYQVKLNFEFVNANGSKVGFKSRKKGVFVDVPLKVA